jgi:hypothetical protein
MNAAAAAEASLDYRGAHVAESSDLAGEIKAGKVRSVEGKGSWARPPGSV